MSRSLHLLFPHTMILLTTRIQQTLPSPFGWYMVAMQPMKRPRLWCTSSTTFLRCTTT